MTEQMRRDLTPQGYIRRMYAETENGEFFVGFADPDRNYKESERCFKVNWTADDAEQLVQRYNLLTSALARIARVHDELNDEDGFGVHKCHFAAVSKLECELVVINRANCSHSIPFVAECFTHLHLNGGLALGLCQNNHPLTLTNYTDMENNKNWNF